MLLLKMYVFAYSKQAPWSSQGERWTIHMISISVAVAALLAALLNLIHIS